MVDVFMPKLRGKFVVTSPSGYVPGCLLQTKLGLGSTAHCFVGQSRLSLLLRLSARSLLADDVATVGVFCADGGLTGGDVF